MPRKKVKINDGHYVEMLDRLNTINIMINELLCDHPVVINHPAIQILVEKAEDAIVTAYQLVGRLDVEKLTSLHDRKFNTTTKL